MSEEQPQFEEPIRHPDVSPEADAKLDRLLEIMPAVAARKLVKEFDAIDDSSDKTPENSDSKNRTWRKAYEPLRGEDRKRAIEEAKRKIFGESDSEESK